MIVRRFVCQIIRIALPIMYLFADVTNAQTMDTAAQGEKQITARLAFQIDPETNGPVVSAQLNNQQEAHLLLDTGSNIGFLSEELAKQLGLTPGPMFTSTGKPFLFNGQSANMVSVKTQLGDLAINMPYVVLPLKQLRTDEKSNVDGIVGLNAMSVTSVFFDFPRKEVTFFYPHHLTPEQFKQMGMKDASVLSNANKSKREFLFAVPVTLNGRIQADVVVDTGTPDTDLPAEILKPLHLKPLQRNIPYTNLYGNIVTNLMQVDTFTVGSLTLPNMKLYTWDHAPEGTQPHIGMDVLSHCRMLIDYTDQKLYLKPVAQEKGEKSAPELPTPAPLTVGVPLEIMGRAQAPFVRLILPGNKPYLFQLDTSTTASFLDRSLAEQAKFTSEDAQDEAGHKVAVVRADFPLSSQVSVAPTSPPKPEIQVPLIVDDLSEWGASNPGAAGILGTNVLAQVAWQFDFGKKQAILFLPGNLPATSPILKDALRLPLYQEKRLLYVDAEIDGRKTRFLLSTSQNTQLRSPATLTALKPVGRVEFTDNVAGTVISQGSVRLHEITLGNLQWKQPVVSVQTGEVATQPDILGLDFLRRYRVTIDLPSKSLYLQPDPAYTEVSDAIVNVGITPRVTAEKEVVVNYLFLHSPAAEAGLQVGDTLLSVNGVQATSEASYAQLAALLRSPAGTELTLHIRRKGEDKPREIKLKTRKLL